MTRDRETEVAAAFAREVADHELTILHDDGVYRHIQLGRPGSGIDRIDIVTWPMHLAVGGDRGTYVFRRVVDMFEFFRGQPGINPHYWTEKLVSDGYCVAEYSRDLFEHKVRKHVAGEIRNGDAPRGLSRAVLDEVLSKSGWGYYDIDSEECAREALAQFEFGPGPWRFPSDARWDWQLHDWSYHYLWQCHAIVWGVARYDDALASSS